MGWGPESFTVPLAPVDEEGDVATYWGCRIDGDIGFINQLRKKAPDAATVIDEIIIDFRPDPDFTEDERPALWGRAHFDAILADLGLRAIGR